MIANKLLWRQFKRCFGARPEEVVAGLVAMESPGSAAVVAGMKAFLANVEESYLQYERDIQMRTRSLDISSLELGEANERLRDEIRVREQALERLRQSVAQLLGPSGHAHPTASDTLDTLSQLIADLVEERLRLEASLRSSKQRFRDLAEMSSDWFWEQDENFRFTTLSVGIGRSGVDPESLLGKTHWELTIIGASDLDGRAHRRIQEMHLAFQDLAFEIELHPGHRRWFSVTGRPVFANDGKFLGYRGIGRDITKQRQAEDELRLAASVFHTSAEGVIVTDAQARILMVNPAFTAITGYSRAEVIGQSPRILSSGMHDDAFYRHMWDALAKDGSWQGEIWDRRKTGQVFAMAASISAVTGEGVPSKYVCLFSDVSERKQAEDRISFLAHHDFLTGLPNRVLMEDRLTRAITQAERDDSLLALLFIDLDNFKTINDSLGHHVGDLVLQQVADRLKGCVRKSDTVCRLGGDEFLIILDHIVETDDAARVAGKVLTSLANQCLIDGQRLNVTPSIGISIYPQDGCEPISLMKNADAAMYHAKKNGRNIYHFFTQDMNAKATERLTLESNLRKGLDDGEFLLHYQPQIDGPSGRIIGLEALVRWQHPECGMVPPARFIPIAEESGLIIPLGEWILRTACRQSQLWRQRGWSVPIAVNISAVQFRHKAFMDTVRQALDDYRPDPGSLVFELTEGVMMGDNDVVLGQLKDLGISLAIDDFGTGYSSLAYLKRFPIDKLKIDQSFVRDLMSDAADAEIIKAIIALGRALDLGIIAEGVETVEQLDKLGVLGATVYQGYVFQPPLAVAALEPLLERNAGMVAAATGSLGRMRGRIGL